MGKWEFVTHRDDEKWGYNLYIMEKCGRGFVTYYEFSKDEIPRGYFSLLHINKNEEQSGLKEALISLCEKIAQEKDKKELCLWVEQIPEEVEWYKERGFIPVWPDATNIPKNCAIWMKKELV